MKRSEGAVEELAGKLKKTVGKVVGNEQMIVAGRTKERKGAARRVDFPGVTIHDPVYIEDGVRIERSEIGPNVSLESGTRVTGSRLRNTIVGRDAKLTDVQLDGSLLGNGVMVEGLRGSTTLGDHSEVTAQLNAERSS